MPREKEPLLAPFVRELQTESRRLLIADIHISLTTLEEVFLKVASPASRLVLWGGGGGRPFEWRWAREHFLSLLVVLSFRKGRRNRHSHPSSLTDSPRPSPPPLQIATKAEAEYARETGNTEKVTLDDGTQMLVPVGAEIVVHPNNPALEIVFKWEQDGECKRGGVSAPLSPSPHTPPRICCPRCLLIYPLPPLFFFLPRADEGRLLVGSHRVQDAQEQIPAPPDQF